MTHQFFVHTTKCIFWKQRKIRIRSIIHGLAFSMQFIFLQYQILQQPLVNQSDFLSILAMLFTTRGFSPKQQYEVNVWCTDSSNLPYQFHFRHKEKDYSMSRVECPELKKKFLFYLFFCPCLCPLMHTIIQVAKAPFSPEKVKMLMIVFLLVVQDLCVCGFLTWGIGMIFRFPLNVLRVYILLSECA